mmetsp:Transcript_21940/g.61322  ORF Transcript_21940/g.61322 Transcript_21940/m.61322 type:complete len:300 (-) Transcript_21940:299-1198(-)
MWQLGMRNTADVRTLLICAAKWLLLGIYWRIFPLLGAVGHMVALTVMFVSCFCVACMVHNAMHRDVFAAQDVEFLWRVALSATFGFPVEAYRPTHNANHHVHTQLEEDHLHTSQMKYRWHFLNLIAFFPTVYRGISKLESAFIAAEWKKRSRTFFLFVSQVIAAHGTTIGLLSMDWRRGLACWFLPSLLGVDGIVTMNMLQHDGCEPVKPGEHRGPNMHVNSARNFDGPVINFITCNNGYHTIHHMYSTTHWSEYPALHKKLIAPRIDPELDQRCMLRYLWRTFFWPGHLPPHRQVAQK